MHTQGSHAATLVREVRLPDRAGTGGELVLELRVSLEGSPVVVELIGDLCPYAAPFVDDELRIIRRSHVQDLHIDLSRLSFLSSDGMIVLALHAGGMARKGATLRLVDPSPMAQRLFQLAGLDEKFALDPAGGRDDHRCGLRGALPRE